MSREDEYAQRFEYRPEFLFNMVINRVIDANVPERIVQSLRVARIEDVFATPTETFLVFGKPNTALVIHKADETGYEKFSAYSLWRRPSDIQDVTRRFGSLVQSGIWLRFINLPAAAKERLRAGMQKFQGKKFRTCVNGNMKVMDFAGFTSGEKKLSTITWPYQLMSTLLRSGLCFEGTPVQFDVIRTSRLSMEDYARAIIFAEMTTPWRHYQKTQIATQAGRMIASLIPLPGQSAAEPALPYEVAPAQPSDREYLNDIHVRVTSDSAPGKVLRQVFGPHALFEISVDRVNVDDFFTGALKPFPQTNPTLLTRVKKWLLFSRPVVGFLRWMMGASNFHEIGEHSERDIYDMLRTHSATSPNKYNIVMIRMPVFALAKNPTTRFIISRINVRTEFVDWVLAKHVLMSGYLWAPSGHAEAPDKTEPYVVWAGECWKTIDGEIVLLGNSGTYQPKEEHDNSATNMVRAVLPHLTIQKSPQ